MATSDVPIMETSIFTRSTHIAPLGDIWLADGLAIRIEKRTRESSSGVSSLSDSCEPSLILGTNLAKVALIPRSLVGPSFHLLFGASHFGVPGAVDHHAPNSRRLQRSFSKCSRKQRSQRLLKLVKTVFQYVSHEHVVVVTEALMAKCGKHKQRTMK